MNDLEKELGLALRREDPPEGFADRVLARVANEPRSEAAPVLPFARRRSWVYAVAAAAAVLVFAFGVWRVATPSQPAVVGSAAAPYAERPKQPDTANPPPVVLTPHVVAPPPLVRVATPRTPRRAPVRRTARPRNDPSLAEAERAKDQLMLALRIASDQLGSARRLVLEESRQPGS
jgi:hypothetical protein